MKPISVHALNGYVKAMFDRDYQLRDLLITGEISNYRPHPSGHMYFTLKDEQSEVSAVMFASNARHLSFKADNGMKVVVRCHVSVYEKKGTYQLYVEAMKPYGIGVLALRYEELKKKLEKEGLFDERHKKPIPVFPRNIAVLTAKQGAALQDVLKTIKLRFPAVPVYIFPIPVQGKDAYKRIVQTLKLVDRHHFGTILLVRGGGSIEDLWNFNEEELVRCIYQLATPVITGVGHNTDTTLVDYVADAACATPTAAAARAVPDKAALHNDLQSRYKRLTQYMRQYLKAQRMALERDLDSYILKDPQRIYENELIHFSQNKNDLSQCGRTMVSERRQKLAVKKQKLSVQAHSFNEQNERLLSKKEERLYSGMMMHIKNDKAAVNATKTNLLTNTRYYLSKQEQNLAPRSERLSRAMHLLIEKQRQDYVSHLDKLDLLSPLKILKRGYSVVRKNNKAVSSAAQLDPGDAVELILADGKKDAMIR